MFSEDARLKAVIAIKFTAQTFRDSMNVHSYRISRALAPICKFFRAQIQKPGLPARGALLNRKLR
jgi:hypothetical protein